MQPRMNEVRRIEERPLGELFSDLVTETTTLVRNEVALAKVEMTQKVTKVGRNVGSLVIGGAIGYAALLAVCAGVILLLDRVMPAWLAALAVGIVIAVVAWILISKALTALRRMDLKPQETVESLKEDAQWIKEQVS
ncbi:MAG TPA: phage holin family protein [Pyrinomonadaceae bacterium]|nr:phage holin family protein [Pyrinomonadaceae bacterium]